MFIFVGGKTGILTGLVELFCSKHLTALKAPHSQGHPKQCRCITAGQAEVHGGEVNSPDPVTLL